jgi:CheY-like chemotaxis protein
MDTILVVDDEPSIRQLVAEVLDDEGYGTVMASDGQEALDALGLHEIQLVISDVMMPRMGGVELLRGIRARGDLRSLPVILISAASYPSLAGLESVTFLQKPFDLQALVEAVEAALSGSSG